MSLLGLDVGTTGTKAIVFSEEGRILSSAYREYPLYHPHPGWIELDPEEVWRRISEALKGALSGCDDAPKAMAICSQGEAFTPVSKKGEILGPCIVTFDNRSADMVGVLAEKIPPEETFQITGIPANQISSIYKMMWLRQERPHIFRETDKFLCWEDFVIWKLGLEPTISDSLAARTGAMDLRKRCWSEKILEAAGIERKLLPEIKRGGEVVGEISQRAADETGLPGGLKVVAGAHDQPAGALGAGVIESGVGMDATGTVECICPAFTEPVLNETMRQSNLCCYPHAARGMYVTLTFNFTGGSLLRWFRDNFAEAETLRAKEEGRDVYDLILEEMPDEPTRLFVQAHFCPTGTPYLDANPVGAIVGLELATTRGEFIRGLLEGVSFEMKLGIETMRKAGILIEELRAIGGGAKSEKWLQLKADMYGTRIVKMKVSEAACLGMAMLAGSGTGVYASIEEAVRNLVKPESVYLPDDKRRNYYQEQFEKYRKLYPLLKKFQKT